jgi:hypothetical protein
MSSSSGAPGTGDKLAFLSALSPADALRYKVLNAARVPSDLVLQILADHVPLSMEEADRDDLAISLAAAAKAFATQLCEEAVDIRDAAGDAPDGIVRERHMMEAYRRVLQAGLLPGTSAWTAGRIVEDGEDLSAGSGGDGTAAGLSPSGGPSVRSAESWGATDAGHWGLARAVTEEAGVAGAGSTAQTELREDETGQLAT